LDAEWIGRDHDTVEGEEDLPDDLILGGSIERCTAKMSKEVTCNRDNSSS
jgi:hypothetical protein